MSNTRKTEIKLFKINEEKLLREYVRKSISAEKLNEDWKSTAAHITLDVVGLIPGIGEAADATNAVMYAKEGDYLFAALSLISCIPELGDILGKGGKIAVWLARGSKSAAATVKLIKVANLLTKHNSKIKALISVARENKKIKPYVDSMNAALQKFVEDTLKLDPNK